MSWSLRQSTKLKLKNYLDITSKLTTSKKNQKE